MNYQQLELKILHLKMILEIHPENPSPRKIKQVVGILEKGGVIIYPTDTVYGIGCDIFNQKAVDKVCRIRKINPAKANLTFICSDISQLAAYAKQIDNTIFKLLKRNLPGPFTFILNANNSVPKLFKNRKKTIGIRIPDHPIPLAIINELDRPILSLSLKSDDEILEYVSEPWEIYEDFQHEVNLVIDGGTGSNVPSTIVDCTSGEVEIIREGKGELV